MKNIIFVTSIILFLKTAYGAVKGFDLKTGKGWLFVLRGFLSGFLFELSLNVNLVNSVFVGFLIGLLTAYTGLSYFHINRWAKKSKYYKKYSDDK